VIDDKPKTGAQFDNQVGGHEGPTTGLKRLSTDPAIAKHLVRNPTLPPLTLTMTVPILKPCGSNMSQNPIVYGVESDTDDETEVDRDFSSSSRSQR
jgi:hypothetical protein